MAQLATVAIRASVWVSPATVLPKVLIRSKRRSRLLASESLRAGELVLAASGSRSVSEDRGWSPRRTSLRPGPGEDLEPAVRVDDPAVPKDLGELGGDDLRGGLGTVERRGVEVQFVLPAASEPIERRLRPWRVGGGGGDGLLVAEGHLDLGDSPVPNASTILSLTCDTSLGGRPDVEPGQAVAASPIRRLSTVTSSSPPAPLADELDPLRLGLVLDGRVGLVEPDGDQGAAGEVDVVHRLAAGEERDQAQQDQDQRNRPCSSTAGRRSRCWSCSGTCGMQLLEPAAAPRRSRRSTRDMNTAVNRFQSMPRIMVRAKPLTSSRPHRVQHDGGQQIGDVRVEDGDPGPVEAVADLRGEGRPAFAFLPSSARRPARWRRPPCRSSRPARRGPAARTWPCMKAIEPTSRIMFTTSATTATTPANR